MKCRLWDGNHLHLLFPALSTINIPGIPSQSSAEKVMPSRPKPKARIADGLVSVTVLMTAISRRGTRHVFADL